MERYIFLLIIFFHFSCSKEEECVVIRNKSEIKGEYYFYFRPNYFPNSQSNTLGGVGLSPDFASGKVSQEIYNQYEIGDEYCF